MAVRRYPNDWPRDRRSAREQLALTTLALRGEGALTDEQRALVAMAPLTLTLPWPPSVNHYWRHVGERVLIARAGREYRRRVAEAVVIQRGRGRFADDARLAVSVTARPPDRRRRDLDNILKALLDAMEVAGVFADDAQIDELHIRRVEVGELGACEIILESIT